MDREEEEEERRFLVLDSYPENLFSLLSEERDREGSVLPTVAPKPQIATPAVDPLPLVDPNFVWSVRDFVSETPEPERPSLTPVLEEIYKLRHDLSTFKQDVASAFESMDFKKVKKNRTLKNRCTFVNRRGENCRGYICKVPHSQLCYAHHILSSSSQYPEKRKKLY
jgi:hypothetical protein